MDRILLGPLFTDRVEAGRALGERLRELSAADVLVLGLPRGGVPVAYEVAKILGAPLDVMVVRKLGLPGQEELAMGAIASGGAVVLNPEVIHGLGISDEVVSRVAELEAAELTRREHLFRQGRPSLPIAGRIVILVDDGLATGATMRAAAVAVRRLGPARLIVAIPVAEQSVCERMAREVDQVVCLENPEPFLAVGLWYRIFGQTSDEEVRNLLERARREREPGKAAPPSPTPSAPPSA